LNYVVLTDSKWQRAADISKDGDRNITNWNTVAELLL